MLICIDYDETFTADPEFWRLVIGLAQHRDHEVVCATMRYRHEGDEILKVFENLGVPVIFTGRKAKADYVKGAGIYPDIWIDDNPIWLLHDSD